MTPELKLLEKYGIKIYEIKKLGIDYKGGFGRKKPSVKLYIPEYELTLFQTMSLYSKITAYKSFSAYFRELLQREARNLELNNDPAFKEAEWLLAELKRINYNELFKKTD